MTCVIPRKTNTRGYLTPIVPGTVIPIQHQHTGTLEEVIILRGKAEEVFFDDKWTEIGRLRLVPGSDTPAIHVPMGQYHTSQSLGSGTASIELKKTTTLGQPRIYLRLRRIKDRQHHMIPL